MKPWKQVTSEGPSNSKIPLPRYFLQHGSAGIEPTRVTQQTWRRGMRSTALRPPVFLRQVTHLFWCQCARFLKVFKKILFIYV